jgi:hypothetical protein
VTTTSLSTDPRLARLGGLALIVYGIAPLAAGLAVSVIGPGVDVRPIVAAGALVTALSEVGSVYYLWRRHQGDGGAGLAATTALRIAVGAVALVISEVAAYGPSVSLADAPAWLFPALTARDALDLVWWLLLARVARNDRALQPVWLPGALTGLLLVGHVASIVTLIAANVALVALAIYLVVVGRRLMSASGSKARVIPGH